MKFSEIVNAAKTLLQQKGRITYRGLAREFDLDDAALGDLSDELIDAQRVAVDEGGKVLVWTGAAADAADDAGGDGERRQLTVMFCDLVGSTALSERLDPEDLHALVSAYQQASRDVITRYGGHVAQYLGDGLLAYFGYPAAHEDDAVRGVQAGLDILSEVGALAHEPPLQVRIGVHTGPVVIGRVGAGARLEQLALGKTPNLAARVQAAAQPHTLAISGDTYRLVRGLFDCDALGATVLKGIAEPVPLYRVSRKGIAASRFDVLLQQGLTPMQDRTFEQAALQERWQAALRGEGQIVTLGGEAGIGKSRLLQAFAQRSIDDGAVRIVFRCSPFHQHSPLYPVVDALNRLLSTGPDDTPEARRERLDQLLASAGLHDDEHRALFALLLAIPLPEGAAPPALSRPERKARTLRALTAWLLQRAQHQPVQLVFEDLHWADPSTLELLDVATTQLGAASLLMLLTHRPDFSPPWPTAPNRLALSLARLSEDDTASVAAGVAGKSLPRDVLEQLIRKTDGVPLYVEEMTRDLLESKLLRDAPDGRLELAGALPPMAVPFSLQDALASRLDRLGSARRLAETASVIGREFSFDLIQAVSASESGALADGLSRLCDAGILLLQPHPQGTDAYVFKQALVRDAAYQSLLIRRRRQTHAMIAQVLESDWPETVAQHPELVAHHYTEAGMAAQAIGFWQRAGLKAVESSANKEAIQHLSRAIEMLQTLPASAERDRQELALHLALGVPLTVTSSWAAPEVRRANARALELCEALGESGQLFQVMYSVWSDRQVQADYGGARPIAEQLLALAERAQDDGLLIQAHRAFGIVGLHTGEFADALAHCDAGYARYDPVKHHSHVAMYWMDPGVGCLCYGAWALMCLGQPDRSLARVDQAVALARDSGHAFSLAYALHFSAVMHLTRREAAATRRQAQALLDLSQAQGFPVFRAWGSLLLGCALAEEGRAVEGIALIRQGQQATQSAGARVARSGSLAVLASVYEMARETELGLATVDEALAFVAQSAERFYEAELYRVRGELLLHRAEGGERAALEADALACFERALATAQRQRAQTWALRAATSLARLQLRRGESDAARAALAGVYGGYREGFDTKDLRDAHALLARLG